MGTSSADPSRLEHYAGVSSDMTTALQHRLSALATTYDAVVPRLQWGVFDLSATFGDLSTYLRLNTVDDAWVSVVAKAFRRADGGSGPRSLSDAALQRALRDAGVPAGARTDLTVDDPVMAGMPPTSGYADDPVCTATGHFLEVEHDLPMPWRAGPLGWLRTYTSRWLREGPFGRGWATWASVGATRLGDGAVEVVLHDGRRAVFLREPDGTFGRVAGLPAALAEREHGGWQLRFANADTWTFDGLGALLEVRSGVDTTTFVRDGGRLVQLAHSSGRTLDLGWDGERVTALRSSDGREVAYAYDTDGDLVQAVQPGGVVRTYVQAGGGLVEAVVDADGVVECRNTYDAEGRVATQLSPHGRTTRFTYASPGITVVDDADGGPVATYVHDPAGRLVAVVDDAGLRQSTQYDEWGSPTAVTDRTGATTVTLHDAWGRVLAVETPDGRRTSARYDDLGRVVERTSPDGAVVQLQYEGESRWPVRSVDPLGAVTELEVEAGEVVAVTDPDGVTTRLERDADGLVTAVVDALGARTVLERAPDGELVSATDPAGVRTAVERDGAGRVVRRLLPGDVVLGLEWSAAGRLTGSVAGDGARTTFGWGDDGETASLTDPTGATLAFEHDRLGRLVRVVDGAGAVVEHEHDGLGRLVALVDPTGQRWLREHDGEGRATALVDPEGRRQERSYDVAGRLLRFDDGAGDVTGFGYDDAGRLATVTRPSGTTSTTYDLAGRRTSLTGPDGATWRYTWSPAGRLQQVVGPSGRVTRLEHDAAGRPLAVTGPDGARRAVRRDTAGRVVAQTGPDGEVLLEHDAAGRVVALVGGSGSRAEQAFDEAGRLVGVTGGDGATRSWSFDPAGRLASMTDPLGGTTSFSYDPVGALLGTTDASGAASTYRYDAAGRATGWTGADGQPVDLALDRSGRLAARTDAAGTLRLDRDAAGRVTGWTDASGAQVAFDLDADGRLVGVREPGRSSTRSYDAAGRLLAQHSLVSAYDRDGLRTSLRDGDRVVTYGRDQGGHVVGLSGPAGEAGVRRDAEGRVQALDAPGLRRRAGYEGGLLSHWVQDDGTPRGARLTRDTTGRVVAVDTAAGRRTLTYDAAGQLVGDDGPAGAWSWEYAAGRRVRATGPDGSTTYAYDEAGRLVRSEGPRGTTTYAYDALGRRVGEQHPDGRVRTFVWDALGRLREVDDGGVRTRLDVDALGDLVAVDGVPLVWDAARPVPALRRVGDLPVTGEDEPVAVGQRWRATDPWGSPEGLDAWGVGPAEHVSGSVGLGLRSEVSVAGLLWLRARVYDPATGQFLSPDPLPPALASATAAAPYAYAGNDPLGRLDPLGLTPMSDADLQAYRDDVGRGLWDRTKDSAEDFALDPVGWVEDHKDALLAAGLIVVGGVLVATGVGAPIGAGILLGATASIAGQIAVTGKVDARQVWVSAAAGGVSGGVGGLFSGSTVAVQVAAGAGADGLTSAAGQLVLTGHVSPAQLALDTAIGGAGGGAGGLLARRGLTAADDVRVAPLVDSGGHVKVNPTPGVWPADQAYAVSFFDARIKGYVLGDTTTLGQPGQLSWVMPLSDALGLHSLDDVVRGTGNAPAVLKAVQDGKPVYGLHIPVAGLEHGPRLPTVADSGGYPHFVPGGHTAVLGADGVHVVNHDVREFVIPGGQPMPPGTVLVEVKPDGSHVVLHAVR